MNAPIVDTRVMITPTPYKVENMFIPWEIPTFIYVKLDNAE